MSRDSHWIRLLTTKLSGPSPENSGRLWATFSVVLPVVLTAVFAFMLKEVETKLSTQLEHTKSDLQTNLEETKATLQRATAYSQAREQAYIDVWHQASTLPNLLRQALADADQVPAVGQNIDKLNDAYHERSLYLSADAEALIDSICHDGFMVLARRTTVAVVESDLEKLKVLSQNDLQLSALTKRAAVH